MTYTATQIENAKRNYNSFLKIETLADYDVENIGWIVASQRMEYNNKIVGRILRGDKELEKEWKLFFLNEEVKKDQKAVESKAKLNANKEASAFLLVDIKKAGKKLGDYYIFLKSDKKYKREFFSKKYTQESVNEFLSKN
jgi:hypothetical protein